MIRTCRAVGFAKADGIVEGYLLDEREAVFASTTLRRAAESYGISRDVFLGPYPEGFLQDDAGPSTRLGTGRGVGIVRVRQNAKRSQEGPATAGTRSTRKFRNPCPACQRSSLSLEDSRPATGIVARATIHGSVAPEPLFIGRDS